MSFVFTLVYVVFLYSIRSKDISEFNKSVSDKRRFHVGMMLRFASPMWWILGMCITLGGGWATYLHIVPDLFTIRFGKDENTASAITAMTQIFPVLLGPFTGFLVERYRAHNAVMITSAVLFLVANGLLFFTTITPVLSSLVFSLSMAIGPVAMISLIPMILPLYSVGTGIGIYKSGHNIGSTVYDILTGYAQDAQGFESVLVLMSTIAAVGVVCAIVLATRKRAYYHNEATLIKQPRWWSWAWMFVLVAGLLTSLVTYVLSILHYAQ
jgi:nitrate/nitrite transporter NarK